MSELTKNKQGQELATLYMQEYLESYKKEGFAVGDVTDGYHSFNELYEHRYALWIALCRVVQCDPGYPCGTGESGDVYRSWKHGDGSSYEGYFILMLVLPTGKQLSYHIPAKYWDKCSFALTVDKAPDWDGHTSYDVIERLGEV